MPRESKPDGEQIPGGPLILRGVREVQDADGKTHPVNRPVVAVCMCELSQRKPWCDATHKARVSAGRSVRESEREVDPSTLG